MAEYAKLVISVDSTQIKRADADLAHLTKTTGAVEKQTGALSQAISGLAGPLAALTAGFSVKALIDIADNYGQMADRIRMATASSEEYRKVQDRLLATANATYRPLAEAQEVYIRTADAIRALGYNTDAVLDITDSFSYLLVTNAASADKASSAISAYSKAVQTGKIDSDSWQSILAAMPSIVETLADGLGRSSTEIRKLGIEGDLALADLNEGLRKTVEQSEAAAAGMGTTLNDALIRASNNFGAFLGESGKVNAASQALSGSLDLLTDNLGTIANVAMAGAIAAASQYAIAQAKSTAATFADLKAKQAKLAAESSAAAAAQRSAVVEQAAAKVALERSRIDVAAAEAKVASDRAVQASEIERLRTTQATLAAEVTLEQSRLRAQITDKGRAQAVARLAEIRLAEVAIIKQVEAAERTLAATTVATSQSIQAAYAQRSAAAAAYAEATTAANATAAASARAAQAAGGLATVGRGLLGVLGGPAGLAITAGMVALAFVDFSDKAEDLESALSDLSKPAKELREEFQKLNDDQQQAAITKWKNAQLQATQEVASRYGDLAQSIRQATVDPASVRTGDYSRQLKNYQDILDRLREAREAGQALSPILQEVGTKLNLSQSVIDSWVRQAGAIGDADDQSKQIERTLGELTGALRTNTDATNDNNAAKTGMSEAGGDYLATLQRQLGSLQDNGSAIKAAERWIREHADATEDDKTSIRSAAEAIEAQSAANRKASTSSKESARSARTASDAIGEYVKSLERQAATAGMTAEQVRQYEVAEKGLTGSLLERAQASLRVLEATDRKKKADDEAAEAAREAKRKQDQINSDASGIVDSLMTEEEAIRASYERRHETIMASTELTAEQRAEALLRLESDTNEQLLEVNGSYWERWLASAEDSLTNFDELAGSVVENFSTNFGNAFESMVFDAQSLDEAVGNMAEGMARSVVNALGQMAAQWLAYQVVQMLVGKTTQASAVTAMTANATAASIQAGLNAFASTAAIPIVGPVAAPGAMAAALAVTAPMVAAVTAAASAGLVGMAHDGIDSVPREGTWLLDKGERVVDSRTNQDLKQYLKGGGGAANQSNVNNINVNVSGIKDSRDMRQSSAKVARDAARAVAGAGRYN